MNNLTQETKLTLVYILIAFAFSVAMRMIWMYQFDGYEPFMFNGQFMINTNDGYFWAEGARDILSGISQENDRSPIANAGSQLTAFFAYVLPFSFETVILFMPVFLSSLVVVPIVLIARGLDNLEMGLVAALLASIAWSYYNRTLIGYYDTDMLNIVLPMFLLWSIIWAVKTNKDIYLIITALDILVYRWWYPQSYALEFSFFGLILFYTLVWDRKNLYNYKLLAIMMFAMLNIDGFIRFPLVLVAHYLFKQERYQKYIYYILALSVVVFFATGGFEPIWDKLKAYIFKDAVVVGEEGLKLHFYSVMQTVREAGQIPFETFANRISGHRIIFILSVVGYIYLAYRHKIMLLTIPMLGLGFLASVGGLRFTIYAVPVLAFGIAFLITEIARLMPTKKLKVLSTVAFTLMVLYPNYKHIEAYKVPTVFNAEEVKILDKLKTVASREDYVVSWWDYGYPLRYYSDVKTLVDGGKHSGSVNFPVSFILTNPQEISAKMARLDVEYTEKTFKFIEENEERIKNKEVNVFSNIEQMTTDYGFKDTNDFLLSMQSDMKLPNKTRDIYLYLPFRMLEIYPTVTIFSNMNLMNGEMKQAPQFFVSKNFKQNQNIIDLGRGVLFDLQGQSLNIGNKKIPIKRFVKTAYDKDMKLQKDVSVSNFMANISVVYMSNYNTFLVLDEQTYNSLYIQLMVLEEFDKTIFEQVLATPHAKVYKLKI
ncbi:peptide transporter [Candidatus Sulfurimonas marisnigri]|uniref:Peptide transporter n=1 Tax=Candidatus Sulfurimonas marisnigri TaxID=2740405 RepID=A0A7S7LZ27_9BACT|nr:STT3 domain-containing protein [Candidatus Sulfurimonas marisnigri]QOY54091.1 peptide transporter [Candidatus Sulfurimonas marisnigri]